MLYRAAKLGVLFTVLATVSVANAQISSVTANLVFDGVQDTNFDGVELTVAASLGPGNQVAVTDVGPTVIDNFASKTVMMNTFFQGLIMVDRGLGPQPEGLFQGGAVSVQFDTYELSGPIDSMAVRVLPGANPGLSQLQAEGLFLATTMNLPGSGIWDVDNPSGSPFSSINDLIFDVGEDLSGYDWNDPAAWNGFAESLMTLRPNDNVQVPEPAMLALLACGGLVVAGRRRR